MEIIKELGNGMFGTVYKVKKDNKYYAMKIEHILKDDVEKNLGSPQWREIHFITKMNSIFPDQFIKLYEYEFIEDCDHVQKYSVDIKEFPKYHQNKIKKLAKSKVCIRKIYELVDGSVRDIIDSLDIKIANTEKELTKTRTYYGNKIKDITSSSPAELNEFFTERYK